MKKTVAIAGATGFIGKWFIDKYKNEFNIINDISSINKNKYDNIWLIGGDKVYKSFIDNDMINSIYY